MRKFVYKSGRTPSAQGRGTCPWLPNSRRQSERQGRRSRLRSPSRCFCLLMDTQASLPTIRWNTMKTTQGEKAAFVQELRKERYTILQIGVAGGKVFCKGCTNTQQWHLYCVSISITLFSKYIIFSFMIMLRKYLQTGVSLHRPFVFRHITMPRQWSTSCWMICAVQQIPETTLILMRPDHTDGLQICINHCGAHKFHASLL